VLVDRLAKSSDFLTRVTQLPFGSPYAHLFLVALQTETGGSNEAYADYLLKGLAKVDQSTWRTELSKEGELLETALTVDTLLRPPTLGQDFQDALSEHAETVLSSGRVPSKFLRLWPRLLTFLSERARVVFLSDLRDRLLVNPSKPLGGILQLYSAALVGKPRILDQKADDVLRHVFRPCLERKQEVELQWLVTVLQNDPAFLDECREESKVDFIKRIDRLIADEATAKEIREPIAEIRRYFSD